jgi:pSer/pThr/pTyr-binding forkhead associated (FHA) protein
VIRLTAVIEQDGGSPRALTHESNKRKIILGRDASCDFNIPVSSISRNHATIVEEDQVYLLEDLGSTHGTLVNGRKLDSGEKKVLRSGDVIEVPKSKITCHIESEKVVSVEPGEATQAVASRAVAGILGRLGEAGEDGAYFRALNGHDEGARYMISQNLSEWVFGRSKECEFTLNDANVSRRHALVRKDWEGISIEDLGSKNGVLVNAKKIQKPRRLKSEDEITIGPIKLVFVDPDSALLDALKDVPGFTREDDLEIGEEFEESPSHVGAPGEDDIGEELEEYGDPDAEENHEDQEHPEQEFFDDETAGLDQIDPALLETGKAKIPDWFGIVALGTLIIGAGVLLIVILF